MIKKIKSTFPYSTMRFSSVLAATAALLVGATAMVDTEGKPMRPHRVPLFPGAGIASSKVPIPEAPAGQEVAAPEDLLPGVGPVMVTTSLPLEEAQSRRLPRATKFANGTASATTTKARLEPRPTGESPKGEEASTSLGPELLAAIAAAKKASAAAASASEASIRAFLATMSRVPDGMIQPRQLVVLDMKAWTTSFTKGLRPPPPVPTFETIA